MDLKLEEFVRNIKEYNADQVTVEFDFVHEGERYKASISVERISKELETSLFEGEK